MMFKKYSKNVLSTLPKLLKYVIIGSIATSLVLLLMDSDDITYVLFAGSSFAIIITLNSYIEMTNKLYNIKSLEEIKEFRRLNNIKMIYDIPFIILLSVFTPLTIILSKYIAWSIDIKLYENFIANNYLYFISNQVIISVLMFYTLMTRNTVNSKMKTFFKIIKAIIIFLLMILSWNIINYYCNLLLLLILFIYMIVKRR